MVEIAPIRDAAHGANIWGVDLNEAITPELMTKLADALYEHRVLIIKEQKLEKRWMIL